ncbi:hypothetical protein NCCP1664_11490 [Zafaria cholistanensis]|uniref:SSD domain-containing protein n=1 Tax=Zafaria cholistanensis TaxID=1682741 RepID=A0A5A7NRA2_9MICC|nr:MMPL family transporter [Zafaria cholistanensis]GER22652.1 hypothetical protein NCCP1664_11490 [Zafaria cholistanensis]
MARFLYRLGRLAYRRRWRFVAAWTVALLAIGASAGAFMGTLSNSFSIPGAASQQTLDRLKAELPELAGGTGSVLYRTADGTAFTPAQAAAVQSALARLGELEDVASVTDPFHLQAEMDSAPARLAEARRQLADARAELAEGRRQLEQGREQLAQGEEEIRAGREQLEQGKEEIGDGRAQLQAAKSEADAGRAELAGAGKDIAAGRAKLEAGQAELTAGRRTYDAGAARLADAARQLAAARKTLAASGREIEAGRAQYDAGMGRLLGGKTRAEFLASLTSARQAVDDGRAQLDQAEAAHRDLDRQQAALDADASPDPPERAARQAAIDSSRAQLPTPARMGEQRSALAASQKEIDRAVGGLAQLDAAKAKLDGAATELAAGRRTLASKEAELAAGRKTLAASKKQLDAGAATLAVQRSKLDAAAARIAAGQARLDAGAAALAAHEGRLIAAAEAVTRNEARLEEGAKTLQEKAAEIPEAEHKLADGEAELAGGEQELVLGERKAASTAGMRFISADGTTAAAYLTFTGSADALGTDTRERIKTIAAAPLDEGVEVYYSKEIVQDLSSVFGPAEVIGLAIAAAVLLAMLGTLVAAGLPLLMAVLGVGAGVGGTLALSSVVEMASITPALALMLGLAVGIDYSLFIVYRHRRQLLEGMAMEESIGRATGTSGNAVVFAGLTVVVALAALAVPGLPFLAVLGYSAAFTVAVSVVISLTLTPAVLGIIGTRLVSRRAWARAAAGPSRQANADGARGWGAVVTRRPWVFAAAGILLLGLAAVPAASLRTALPDGSAEPEGSSALQAYELMSDRFGAGHNGPVMVVADLPAGLDAAGAEAASLDLAERLRQVPGVVAAVPVDTNQANTVGVIQVIPQDGPASGATEELVHTLRGSAAQIEAETGSAISLTGQVAIQVDVSAKLAQALPPYLGIVVGLSLVLLLLVFRSVVVPLLATAGFLLSLAAAFGATVAVYQWGWLGAVFGVHTPGPIMSFLPILLTGILFGLAMDYQVFLVSGMRESYAHGQPARVAVRSGFAHAAPVVTAAALIMASVFAGFVFAHLTMMRAIGFSLAVGVLIDAFIVRMTIIPAAMHLLGGHAWYIPRWLDRIVPDVDVEGARLEPERPRDTVDA